MNHRTTAASLLCLFLAFDLLYSWQTTTTTMRTTQVARSAAAAAAAAHFRRVRRPPFAKNSSSSSSIRSSTELHISFLDNVDPVAVGLAASAAIVGAATGTFMLNTLAVANKEENEDVMGEATAQETVDDKQKALAKQELLVVEDSAAVGETDESEEQDNFPASTEETSLPSPEETPPSTTADSDIITSSSNDDDGILLDPQPSFISYLETSSPQSSNTTKVESVVDDDETNVNVTTTMETNVDADNMTNAEPSFITYLNTPSSSKKPQLETAASEEDIVLSETTVIGQADDVDHDDEQMKQALETNEMDMVEGDVTMGDSIHEEIEMKKTPVALDDDASITDTHYESMTQPLSAVRVDDSPNVTLMDVVPEGEQATKINKPLAAAGDESAQSLETTSLANEMEPNVAPLTPPSSHDGVSLSTATAPKEDVVHPTSKESVSSYPYRTEDIIKSIATSGRSENGRTRSTNGLQRSTASSSSSSSYSSSSSSPPSSRKGSLKTSLSILTRGSSTIEEEYVDDETATDSLRRYIQDQARNMTRWRMGRKTSSTSATSEPMHAFQPPVIDRPRVVKAASAEMADSSRPSSSDTDELPVYYAPVVDNPYETTATTTRRPIETTEMGEQSNAAVVVTGSDEQVAKSLKKKSNVSYKRARRSAALLLLTVASGAIVMGKRLVTIAIGRGML